METVVVDYRNVEDEHICCCLSDKECVTAKKEWLKNNFEEGLVFRKGNVKGKVFVEYMPAESAWCPLDAPGYMFINCLWVAGKYQKQGYARALINECIAESKIKGKKGLALLSSATKKPYLADKKFLTHFGFQVADTAPPYFELMALPFDAAASLPQFAPSVKKGEIAAKNWVLYYSSQCPFTAKYVPLAEKVAKEMGVDLTLWRLDIPRLQRGEAEPPGIIRPQEAPSPFWVYSLFHEGKFVTHEMKTEAQLRKLWE